MRKWTKSAGIVFMAASAVCSARWIIAAAADPAGSSSKQPAPASPADAADPFASGPASGSGAAPATQPAKGGSSAPAQQGQSVTASQVNVSDTGTVEIHVNDANLVEVLRMLSLQSQKNIIASKEVHGTITANLYDVTVKEALDAVLHANGYDYREKGNFIYVYTTKELQDIERAAQVKKTEVFRLYYTTAVNAVNLLKPVLSTEAQVALTTPAKAGLTSGTATGDDHANEDILVVTDYPEYLERARKVLREVDRRPQQVLVEATILVARLDETNQLGIDFTVLGGVNFSTLGAINGASTGGASSGGTSGGGSSGGSSSGGSSGSSGSTTGGPTASTSVNNALSGQIIDNTGAAGAVNKGFVATAFGGSGLNIGAIYHNIGVFLTALEGVTDTSVLANPKVLVLNKQQGEVHVGDELGYKTTVATETLTASNVSFLDTGTRLVFRPFVGDNGYVRLEVHPEDSSGTIDSNGNPQKNTTEITSNVMVKDGHTIVIGGLFRDSTSRTRSQVPFLGSLPGVGPLFRSQTDATHREEIIILLTPHIVKDLDQYGEASEQEAKYANRLEVGMRRGLMPWGRERLAESWYEAAVAEMNKPHPNRQVALWHLNCAISLNPLFSEAMELRAQVTGQEVTATDDSAIRSFVRRQILAERAMPTTMPGNVADVMIDGSVSQSTGGASPRPTAAQPAVQQTGTTGNPPARSKRHGSSATGQTPTATTNIPSDAVEEVPGPADDHK